MKALFGRKVGMTRVFTEEGKSVPVTVLELEPNTVFQVKTPERDGYKAVQVGIGSQKAQRMTRSLTAHCSKAKKGMPKTLAEIRLDKGQNIIADKDAEFAVGDQIALQEDTFEPGSKVDVVGNSIGKGYAGVMKRHGMAGAIRTHGTHEYFRHGGSIGCRKFPGRVFKNKKMAGHMGDRRVMQRGLTVVAVRPEENLLLVRGSIPGPKNGTVYVRSSNR